MFHVIVTVVGAIVGVYEVIVRAVPTVKNYSVIHKIIDFLSKLSGFLNVEK